MEMLKLIGMLIEYPDEALWQHQDEIRALAQQQHQALMQIIDNYLATPPLDLKADRCALSERAPATSSLPPEPEQAESRAARKSVV